MFTLIILLTALISGAVSLITGTGKLVINHRDGKKTITKRGWVCIVFTMILVALPPVQNWLQERHNKEQEKLQLAEQDKREARLKLSYDSTISVMKDKFDTSNQKSISIISETLGKYGYKLDSANKVLKKTIADSSNKNKASDDPVLQLASVDLVKGIDFTGKDNEGYHYRLSLFSLDAASSNYEVKASFVVQDSILGYAYMGYDLPISKESKLSKENSIGFYVIIPPHVHYAMLYVWLRGKYKNFDGSKLYTVDEVYYNNKIGNSFGTIKGDTRLKAIEAVKKSEK